ncbi:MAG: hypothetical protein ABIR58_02430 [Gemmatimonadaceae bacterium]
MLSLATLVVTLIVLAIGSRSLPAQGPNPTNLWSVSLSWRGSVLVAGKPVKLTHDDGVNSQPSFTPDGRAIVFSATRDTGSSARSEIYRYDFASAKETRVTTTPENENSPTVNARGEYLAVRWVPATLFKEFGPWVYAADGSPRRRMLPVADTTGYYTPLAGGRFILTRPKSRTFTVAMFDSAAGTIVDLDSGVPALPVQRVPNARAVSYVVIDSAAANHTLRRYHLVSRRRTNLGHTVPGRTAHTWIPDRSTILMAKGNVLYSRRAGARADTTWRVVATFDDPDLRHASAYVVSPDGGRLILTSPKRLPLAVVVRDSLEAGRAGRDISAMVMTWRGVGLSKGYDVTEASLIAVGDAWLARRHFADAVALQGLSTLLFPLSHRAMARLGDAQRAAGDNAAAGVAYEKALALNIRATKEEQSAADSVEQRLKGLR